MKEGQQENEKGKEEALIKAGSLSAKKIHSKKKVVAFETAPHAIPSIPENTLRTTAEFFQQESQRTLMDVKGELKAKEMHFEESRSLVKHTDESQAQSEQEARERKKKKQKHKSKSKKKEGKEEESEEEKIAKDSLINVKGSASFRNVSIDNSTTYNFYGEKDSSLLNANASDMQQAIASFPASLKACYEKQKYLSLPFSDIKLRLRKDYINLAIIHYEEQKEKEKALQPSTETKEELKKDTDNAEDNTLKQTASNKFDSIKFQDARLTSYEELFVPKQSIKVKKLFELHKVDLLKKPKVPMEPPERLLIWGRAGIGKSTFCQYVAHRWSCGELWPDFKALFWIPLRWITTYEVKYKNKITTEDLAQFLKYVLKQQTLHQHLSTEEMPQIPSTRILKAYLQQAKSQKSLESEDKILFLLDGFDEVAGLLNESSAAGQLLQTLMQQRYFILTSRPGYTIDPRIVSRQHHLEVLGFTNADIPKYVKRLYPKLQTTTTNEEAEQLIEFLQTNPSLWGVAHIPINLALICSTLDPKRLKEIKNKTTFTLTALYSAMVLKLSRRYVIEKCQIKKAEQWPDHEILAFCQPILDFLGKLAFEAFQQKEDTLIISKQMIENLLQDPLHSKALKEHVEKIKQKTKLPVDLQDEHFVLNNLLQMGFLKSLTESNAQPGYYFIHLTFQEYFAADYLASQLQILSTKQDGKLEAFIQKYKYDRRYEIVWWFTLGLLPKKFNADVAQRATNHFFHLLCQEPQDLIGLRHALLLIRCLEECELKLAKDIKQALLNYIKSWLKAGFKHREIQKPLIQYLRLCPQLLQEPSLVALANDQLVPLDKIGDNFDPTLIWDNCERMSPLSLLFPAVQDRLFVPLNDSREASTSVFAARVLGEHSTFFPEISNRAERLLTEGQNKYVLRGALLVFKFSREEVLSPTIVERIGKLLGNKDVRFLALEVLAYQKKLSAKAVKQVVELLTDKDVRWQALRVLENQNELSVEAVEQVVKLLADKHIYEQAWRVLARQKELSTEVVEQVAKLLPDENTSVRSWRLRVLAHQKKLSAKEPEQVAKLLTDEEVRFKQKKLPAEEWERVVKLLADEDRGARLQGLDILAKQAELSVEAVEQVVKLLADKDKYVRRLALWVLVNQNELSVEVGQVVKLLADEDKFEALKVLNQLMLSSSFLDYLKNVKKIPAALEKYASEIFVPKDITTFGTAAITLTHLCELYYARPVNFLILFIVIKSLEEECALYFKDDALCFFVNNKLATISLTKQQQKNFSQAIRKELKQTYGLKISVDEIFKEKSSIVKLLSRHLPFSNTRSSSSQLPEEKTEEVVVNFKAMRNNG